MKKNLYVKALLVVLALCLSTFVSAAPNLTGNWKGTASKVTDAACNLPVAVVLTISQCKVGSSPGNLFKGTLKLGTASVKIVGRIEPDSSIQIRGTELSLTTGSSKTAFLVGKYLPATSKIQITQFTFVSSATAALGNEMYDIITLAK